MVKFWPRWNGQWFLPRYHCSQWYFNAWEKSGHHTFVTGFGWGTVELSDGKILTTMEWLMVFAKVPLYSMVFQWFSNMWTIGVNGFSMVFYLWIIGVNGFSMVFQIWTIGMDGFSNVFLQSNHCHCINGLWLTIDIDGLSMVLGKVNAGSQKRPKRKKTWFVEQKHRGKQTLDRLTQPNVTKVSLGNHFSSTLALWLPPLQHLKVFILTIAIE